MKDELQKLREKIDSIDDEIVALLSKRMEIVKEVGKLKKEHKIEQLDIKRLEELMDTKKKKEKLLGVSQTFITRLYKIIHDHSVKTQKKV
jgi:chorismate mutase